MYRPKQALPILALTSFALCGCNKLVEALEDSVEAQTHVEPETVGERPDAPPDPEPSPDDLLARKLDPYIQCINKTSSQVHQTEDRYHLWVDPKTGPTGKERHVYGLYEVREPKDCLEGIAAAAELEPDHPALESAAKAYADALEDLHPHLDEAFEYYDEKNYEDDDFARGKSLHIELETGFAAFSAASEALHTLVDDTNDGLQVRNLERIEAAEGRTLYFWAMKLMLDAKKLLRVVDSPVLDDIDQAELTAAVEAYEASLDSLTEYVDAHPDEPGQPVQLAVFHSTTKKLLKHSKALARRKRDGTPFSADDAKRGVEGHPTEIWSTYNELVRDSNGLSWREYRPDPS